MNKLVNEAIEISPRIDAALNKLEEELALTKKLVQFGKDHLFETIADAKADLSNAFPGHKTKVTVLKPQVAGCSLVTRLTVDDITIEVGGYPCDDVSLTK